MTDGPKKEPRIRLRTLLAGGEEEKPAEEKYSPLQRLPKKESASFLPDDADKKRTQSQNQTPIQEKVQNLPKASNQSQGKLVPVSPPLPGGVSKGIRLHFGPPFWTITGIISLAVNAILIAVLVGLLWNMRTLPIGKLMDMGNGLLGGLYTNFELMDRAHITTTIPVETTIPVKFDLQLNQQTNVVLSQDVTIDNALVTVQTGGLNITRARTTIVLPQGTSLPIVLNLTVPVDQTVPVTLNVPVDIALEKTDLHKPFVGLQSVLQPFYCMINKSAVNMDGQSICK